MKKYLILLLFPFLVFGAENPAIHTIQNIDSNQYNIKNLMTLEDGSAWEGYSYKEWNQGDQVVILYDNEWGFMVKNLETKRSLFVSLATPPKTQVTDIKDTYFVLSNGLILERKDYMQLDIGDHIFLCTYFLQGEADEIVVYNVSKPWVGDRTKVVAKEN